MNKIFQFAVISLLVLIACNDGINNQNDGSGTDTSSATAVDNARDNNMVSKKGIELSPNQEVPTNQSKASGTADVSYNKDSKVLTFTVNYNGLTSEPSMAHIHGTAPKGANSGVKHDLTNLLQKAISGSFSDSVKIESSGIKEDSLLSGFYYFNIHTPAHPGGEIRGQIEF